MHRSAFTLTGTGGFAEQFGHNRFRINPFSEGMPVRAVGGEDVILAVQDAAHPGGNRLLANI